MKDLTVIFLTNNRVPELWAAYHREVVTEAIGDAPLITMSRKPMDWGTNIIQTEPIRSSNIFWQMLKAAKIADTPFIAIVEDDTVYTREHFTFRPPTKDIFWYNANRWYLFTWGEPIYSLKNYIRTNAALVAPRQLTIDSLEERFMKYPPDTKNMPKAMSGELGVWEKYLGITLRRAKDFKTFTPMVQIDHDFFTIRDWDNPATAIQKRRAKKLAAIQAYDIPVWGRAENLVRRFC